MSRRAKSLIVTMGAALFASWIPLAGQTAGSGFYQRGTVYFDWYGSRYSDGTFFNQISARFRFDLINRPGQGWTLTLDARDRVGIRGAATNQAILYNARLTFDKAGSPFYLSLGQMNLYDTAGIGALLGGVAGFKVGRDLLAGAYGGLESTPYINRLDAKYLKAGAFVRWLGSKGRTVGLSYNLLRYDGRAERQYAYANLFLPVEKVLVVYGDAEYEMANHVDGANRLSRLFGNVRLDLGRWVDLTASYSSGRGLDFHSYLIAASQDPTIYDQNVERFYYTGYYGVRLSMKPTATVRLSISRQQSEQKDLGILNHTWRFGASAWNILGKGISVVGDYALNRGDLSESDTYYVSLTKDFGRFSLNGSFSNSFNGVRFDSSGGEPSVIHLNDARNVSLGALVLMAGALFPLLLVLGAQKGTGQEKAVRAATAKPAQEWTAESHDKTNFPLVGKHRTLTCRECHVNNVFEGTPTDCEVCHWQRRQDDRYGLRLGTRCADCHTPQAWKKVDPVKWSHETETGFRLEGMHRTLDCEACHGSGGFAPRPTDCNSCHRSDYQGTREPNHAEANFPTDCRICHNQRGWSGASFGGHGGFELRGRHATAACSDCHKNGVYAGMPTDCAVCHLNDYNGTTDPDHRAAGFPLDCTECHGTSASGWTGASFVHDFPIQSGKHAGLACSECHRTSDFRSFSCLDCHTHDQTDMDDKHRGVTGYAYSSQACYACHPRGTH